MKSVLMAGLMLWCCIVLELTWPAALPHGSLLLPMICGALFWVRTPAGIAVAGCFLLIDMMIRPVALPLNGFLLPLLAAVILAPERRSHDFRRHRRLWRLVPPPLHLPLITLLSVLLQQISVIPVASLTQGTTMVADLLQSLPRILLIAIPLSGGLSLTIRLADELGLRRGLRITV